MPREVDVEPAAYGCGEGIGAAVARGAGSGEVAVESVHAADRRLAKGRDAVQRTNGIAQAQLIGMRFRFWCVGSLSVAPMLIDNPGLDDPTELRTILAHVGLARAYALQGKTAESREEYEKFFALWKDADPGLSPLVQAQQEYAKLADVHRK